MQTQAPVAGMDRALLRETVSQLMGAARQDRTELTAGKIAMLLETLNSRYGISREEARALILLVARATRRNKTG